ncbi:N-acetylmuramoyl-L-alanine amidase [Nocardiopsis sp. HNM0947]|uniref:N-acetylmuramoyl-L-alanine amidase n=1 Tax=Nocardiopsis coralli TaxID=2772213 RepID=A0ABR9P9E7_9ACTN|nr:peptidoglycan recognition family protein [Nocardiopsis coralli]MBE3000458.1 N-acetylmuramoyl-L-alanine amidase [Nocardiopsis coralli]
MPDSPTPGPDRRTLLRGAALTSGAVAIGGAFTVAPVQASPVRIAEPSLYTRADWDARSPSSPVQILAEPPTQIVVHHTATPNSDDLSEGHALALSRSIQNFHMDDNGWIDTGQQLTISRGGHIMEGRDRALPAIREGTQCVGTHVANHNNTTIGIENEGTYTDVEPTSELIDALVETLAWLCEAYGLNPQDAIVGHRDFNATECPGEVLYGMLPDLRSATTSVLEAKGVSIPPRGGTDPADAPSYPAVPDDEPERTFYHGPARGADDISR